MDRNGKHLLALLRSSLWGIPADVEGIDWPKVLLLARQQTVLNLISDAVSHLPDELRPGEDTLKKLQQYLMRNCQAHALLNRKVAETVSLMRSNDISPVLFKGQGLALNYPDPLLRQCGDIDLYVGKENYRKACEVAVKAYGAGEDNSESIKHMHLDNGGVSVEIHRIAESVPGLVRDRRFQEWTEHHLGHSQRRKVLIGGISVDLPPVNFDAIYIMNHTWHHFVNGGIGIRQVCDWTLYLHRFHSSIDVHELETDLDRLGLRKVWQLFSHIAVNHLGLPENECPLYDGKHARKAERVLDIIMDEGNFGRYSSHKSKPRPKGYSEGKFHSFKVNTLRVLRVMGVHPSYILMSWCHYVILGVYHFVKDFR